jgi:hypothetical protein
LSSSSACRRTLGGLRFQAQKPWRVTLSTEHNKETAWCARTAAPVDEPTRRRVITAVLDLQNRPEFAARVSLRQDLDDWLARSPLVRDRVRRRAVADGVLGAVGWSEPPVIGDVVSLVGAGSQRPHVESVPPLGVHQGRSAERSTPA